MTQARIGALRVDLGMNTAAFEQGVDLAQRKLNAFSKRMKNIGSRLQGIGKAMSVGVTAPIVAAGAAFVNAAGNMADEARAMGNAATLAGEDFETFQRQAHAASKVGIEFDKLGDIFKDVRERVGEFVVSGGGPLQDAFDALNSKVRLTVDELRGLSGKDALQLIVNRMEEAKLSTEEMSFVLESLGSDATALIPLLRNNGQAFDELGGKAAIISDKDREQLEKYKDAQEAMAGATRKLTIAFVDSGLLEALTKFTAKAAEAVAHVAKANPTLFKFGIAFTGIAAAIGPALFTLGGLIQMAPGIAKGLGVIATGFKILKGAMLALLGNPVILGAAIVIGGIYLAWKNWDKIKPIIDAVGKAISDWWKANVEPVFNRVKEAIRAVVDIFRGLFADQIKNVVDLVSALMKGDFSGAWEAAKAAASRAIEGLFDLVKLAFPGMLDTIGNMVRGVQTWLRDKLGAVLDWVMGKLRAVNDTFAWLYNEVVGNSHIPDMVDGIASEMARLDTVMVDPARKAAQAVDDAMREMAAKSKALMERLFPEIARARQFAEEMANIDTWQVGDAEKGEARQRLNAEYLEEALPDDWNPWAGAPGVPTTKQLGALKATITSAADTAEMQTVRIAESFKDMAQRVGAAIKDMASSIKGGGFFDILNSAIGLFTQLAGTGLFGSKLAGAVNSSFGGFRAEGGPVMGNKTYLVGERGPELFSPGRSGSIIPNEAMKGGGTTRVEIVDTTGLFQTRVTQIAGQTVHQAVGPISDLGAAKGVGMMRQNRNRSLVA